MTKQIILFALLSASIAGCTKDTPTEAKQTAPDASTTVNKVEVIAEGGIAALDIRYSVSQDDRFFVYTQRHLCNNNCAASDSTSGSLSAAATDALFKTVFAQSPFDFKDDYGTSRGAADMMEYTIRITIGADAIKTIRADDGTMPEPLRRIVSAVLATVSAARK
jgi:hypothetical protein